MPSSDADVVSRVQRAVADALHRRNPSRNRPGIQPGDQRYVVAVSGGPDSTCLLDALVSVLPDPTNRLVVGHVDHQLRPDSDADAKHVRALAERFRVRFVALPVNVPELMASERLGMEEAARIGRYRALSALNEGARSDAILTGHTRDDSIETVLMHLLRGTGRRGLGGIEEVDDLELWPDREPPVIQLVRPLLRVTRAETAAYCEARDIPWITDPTNADPRLLRNRVRHHLLPVLRTYNPAVDDAIDRLSSVMRDEEAYLHEVAIQRYHDIVRQRDNVARVSRRRWISVPVALKRRLVREIAEHLGRQEIGLDAVARALSVGAASGPSGAELGGGITVKRLGDDLVFERRALTE